MGGCVVNPFSKASPDEKSGLAVLKSFPPWVPSNHGLWGGSLYIPTVGELGGRARDWSQSTPLCNVREAPDSIAARPWTCHFLGVGPIGHLRGGDETENEREEKNDPFSV